MRPTDNESTKKEIKIYQSLWKNMFLAIGCFAFAVGGCMIIRDYYCNLVTKILGGWCSAIFFGGGGLFLTITTLYNRIHHIPFLIIHEDRLELYKQCKGSYYNIYFTDVRNFRFISLYSSKMIAIDYKNTPLIHKVKESSDFKQNLISYNFKVTGAIENIPAHNLTMKGKEICNLLNICLKRYCQKEQE